MTLPISSRVQSPTLLVLLCHVVAESRRVELLRAVKLLAVFETVCHAKGELSNNVRTPTESRTRTASVRARRAATTPSELGPSPWSRTTRYTHIRGAPSPVG